MEREEIRQLVAELVTIPSMNPLEGPVGEGRGEAALASFVQSRLQRAGIDAQLQPVLPERPNVIARLPGESEEAIWFDAHLDTVTGEGMAAPSRRTSRAIRCWPGARPTTREA